MPKLLIINFNKNRDIISTAHLINSVKKESPDCEVSLLVFSEFLTSAKCLRDVHRIYTIDRKKVSHLKKSKIFSPAQGLSELYGSLAPLKEIPWDNVLNFSNNTLGALIISFLAPKTFTGIAISPKGTVKPSDNWSLLFNEVLPNYPHTPIHFMDCYHKMMRINWVDEEIKINTLQEHNHKAHQNLTKLRKKINREGEARKIVGIAFKASQKSRDIPLQALGDLLELLYNDKYLYPVLIISHSAEEKDQVNRLNGRFDNQILSIEADFLALASILLNIDLLVTPDNSVKHMADLVSVPLVEISLGSSALRKQGTVNPNNILLAQMAGNPAATLTGSDVYQAINRAFNLTHVSEMQISPGFTLYESQNDHEGIWYRPIAGQMNVDHEISHLMARLYIHTLFSDHCSNSSMEFIVQNFKKQEIYQWIDEQMDFINGSVKDLLHAIRTIRTVETSVSRGNDFVESLGKLLGRCEYKSLIAIPYLIFRAGVDSIESTDLKENIKDMEKLLFELKCHIQILTKVISDLSTFEKAAKKGNIFGPDLLTTL